MELVVTAKQISERFDALIQGVESRESIESWADARMHAEDARTLRYEPQSDEDRLWDAIGYLQGVGSKTEHGYLFSRQDFETYRSEHGF